MPDTRRTPSRGSGPAGRRGPGRRGAAVSRAGRATSATSPAPSAPRGRTAVAADAPRQRLTGRAAILVLVLAVLAVSYASSMRAYLQQRAHIGDLESTISERQASIDDLEREKTRWEDPEYVRAQARERLGYVMPGETPYVVLQDGAPLESGGGLTDPDSLAQEPPSAWYADMWDSTKVAGNPPRQTRPPLTEIDGSDASGSAGSADRD